MTSILDNALNDDDFYKLKNIILGSNFNWFYNDSVSFSSEDDPRYGNGGRYLTNYYFTHLFYGHNDGQSYERKVSQRYRTSISDWFDLVQPILNVINPRVLIRVKANLYPSTPKLLHHESHIDLPYEHKGAIFYVNTNDGLTMLDDGTEVESIENRLLLFNPSLPHNSTTCTNAKCRVNINFNYM